MTRLVYLGTSEFAAEVLAGLIERGHQAALVVTRPDAPRGRGRKLAAPPVAERAHALGLDVFQPQDVNSPESVARIESAAAGEVVVCAFGALVTDPLLSAHRPLNVHPSLLPRWRGAAPIERAIISGDERTGVSIMELVAELDAGPVVAQRAVAIEPDDTYGSLSQRLQALSVELLDEVLVDPAREFAAQDAGGVTYAEKIAPADRTLDLDRPAIDNDRIVRALAPHIGARVALSDDSYLGVLQTRVGSDGELEFISVQPAGGRPMPYADYARGHGPVA